MKLSKNWLTYKTRIRGINKINVSDLIYLAGIFDGEGCITLGKAKNNYTPTYHLNINVTNTNKDLIDWIAAIVGKGGVILKPKENIMWKDCYTWKLNGELAVQFITKIYPYLKVKKLQAEIAIKYGKTIQIKQERKKLTDDVRDDRRKMFLEIRELNHRNNGVKDGSPFHLNNMEGESLSQP